MNKKLIVVFLFLFSTLAFSQKELGIGVSFGGGSFQANSPNTGSLSSSLNLTVTDVFMEGLNIKADYMHLFGSSSALPGNKRNHFTPFMNSYSLSVETYQLLSPRFFIMESAGLIYINDRMFPDVNKNAYGFTAELRLGYKINNDIYTQNLQFGFDYGLAVTASSPSFLQFSLLYSYFFSL